MGDTNKLSYYLLDCGFFSALGSTEKAGRKLKIVKLGKPNTIDHNNGILVIYDEEGRPWIPPDRPAHKMALEFCLPDWIETHDLTRGAYVPHSNDGGQFVSEVLPTLNIPRPIYKGYKR